MYDKAKRRLRAVTLPLEMRIVRVTETWEREEATAEHALLEGSHLWTEHAAAALSAWIR